MVKYTIGLASIYQRRKHVLQWLAAGDRVYVTSGGKIIARMIPDKDPEPLPLPKSKRSAKVVPISKPTWEEYLARKREVYGTELNEDLARQNYEDEYP